MSDSPAPSAPHAYAPLEPYDKGRLQVDGVHSLYYEQSGDPNGPAVIFIHGGPGGGTSHSDRKYFAPTYRTILLDQRGAGQSTPSASLENNTTWDLVEDLERLRKHLGVERWVVFGGSWGSTLSLAYAQKYPEVVKGLILRGIFTLRRSELLWFYQDGASHIFPDAFDDYLAPIPPSDRSDLISAYYARLTSDDAGVRVPAAKAWSTWELQTSRLYVNPDDVKKADQDEWALAFARIEAHYFVNAGFMRDGQLLEKGEVDKIRHIPTVIVQGRYDLVCPAKTAWELHKVFPEAEFHIVPDAGHSAKEQGITKLLVQAADKFRTL